VRPSARDVVGSCRGARAGSPGYQRRRPPLRVGGGTGTLAVRRPVGLRIGEEAAMAARARGSALDRLLGTGPGSPPRENALALLTLAFGIVSAVCALVPGWHVPASWTGAAGMVLGAWAQMISSTTPQRWVIVPGWVLAFLGLVLGMDAGGFW
jgi:hypothetical protein